MICYILPFGTSVRSYSINHLKRQSFGVLINSFGSSAVGSFE
ncbi:MAG: hypothetical protein ACTS6G_04960 [Candidatus Hodgkinia cicadicola]